MNLDELDGRMGEGWGGHAPNGSHVNVVLARRGSPTAAAAISMLANPSPGHTPVLCCVGETPEQYEPIWPPTLMMNKATASHKPARSSFRPTIEHLETRECLSATVGLVGNTLSIVRFSGSY